MCNLAQSFSAAESESDLSDLFRDRIEAGELLGRRLKAELEVKDLVVVALPRGGIITGLAIARQLEVPLDFLAVRKLGAPWQRELAIGAIAAGGFIYLNQELVERLGVTTGEITRIQRREEIELTRREGIYRRYRPRLSLADKQVLVVDDGIATGATITVAIRAIKASKPKSISVAIPVAAISAVESLHRIADHVYALKTPEELTAIGDFYECFESVSDDEVIAALQSSELSREVLVDDK